MYQVETDSEDDYECLFLKPVDGYNISDRIRQANEELFASPGPESPSVIPRKVTFRKVLEEYDDGADNISIVSVESTNSQDQKSTKQKLKHIPEEEDEKQDTLIESETEEICEEIIEFKLDTAESISNETSKQNFITSQTLINNDNGLVQNDEINNKNCPKTSPLPTLQEERDSSIKFEEILLSSPHSSFDKTTISPSSSEDDLSVIVASYIPEGLEIIEEKSTDDSIENNKKSKIKKFSFRRKKKLNSPIRLQQQQNSKNNLKNNKNQIVATNSKNHNNNNNKIEIDDDIKFHYKTCCEYKNAIDTNPVLPKYTGYLSEYGLTKDQLKKRQLKIEKQKSVILEKNLKSTEYEMQKMDSNERAFTRWLKNKMRYPVNKTKNMFDFHQTRISKKVKS